MDHFHEALKEALASLPVGLFAPGIGQGGADLDVVFRIKIDEFPVGLFQEDDQVGADDRSSSLAGDALQEFLQVRIHFRGAAGDIHGRKGMAFDDPGAGRECFGGHQLPVRRRRLHMAMPALQIAELAHVHLKNVDGFGCQRETGHLPEPFVKSGQHGLFAVCGAFSGAHPSHFLPGAYFAHLRGVGQGYPCLHGGAGVNGLHHFLP